MNLRWPSLPSLPEFHWPQWQALLALIWPWAKAEAAPKSPALYDGMLITSALGLMAFGLVMVFSASAPEAARLYGSPYYFAIRHGIFLF